MQLCYTDKNILATLREVRKSAAKGIGSYSPQRISQAESKQMVVEAWMVWLSGVSAGFPNKGSLVPLPVRAHAWVAGQVPSRGHKHLLIFFSPLSKNKTF